MEHGALGNAIRCARIAHGLSQERLAELLDITTSHLKHIESEHRKPSVEVLFALATRLDLSLDALLFPGRESEQLIHTQGLSPEEAGAVARLVDIIRAGKGQPSPPADMSAFVEHSV